MEVRRVLFRAGAGQGRPGDALLPSGARIHAHRRGGIHQAQGAGLLIGIGRMDEFAPPKNSKINKKGKVHKAAPEAKNVKEFKIHRYDPDTGEKPRIDRQSTRLNSSHKCDYRTPSSS